MSPDRVALRAAAAQATRGPWYAINNDLVGGMMVRTLNQPPSQDTYEERKAAGVPDVCALTMRDEDARYLALCSPDIIPAILDALDAAEGTPQAAIGAAPPSDPAEIAAVRARLNARYQPSVRLQFADSERAYLAIADVATLLAAYDAAEAEVRRLREVHALAYAQAALDADVAPAPAPPAP